MVNIDEAVCGMVQVEGWSLVVAEGAEPMVLDVELGERLGFARPRDFRKLIERLISEDVVRRTDWRATVARQTPTGRGGHRGTVTAYHLTEVGALLAIAKSRTPKANEITRQMVEVFVAYRAGKLTPAPPALPTGPDTDASRAMAALSEAYRAAQRAQVEHTSARWGVAFGALTRLLSDVEGLLTQTGTEEAIWALSDAANAVSGQVSHAKSRRTRRAPDSPNAQPTLPGVASDHSAFFAARCVLSPEARIPVKALRLAYHAWCEAEGLVPLGPRFFGRFVRAQGCKSSTVRDASHQVVEGFAGVRLA